LFPQKIHPNLDEVYQFQTKKTEGKWIHTMYTS
jgi:hypothetical protein